MKRIKKALLKILILVCVFVVGVAGTALLLNSVSTDDRSELNDATFPEVMIDMDGTLVNRMYGYATAMQADFTRDSVTPLDTTKQLTFVVNPYASEVTGFSYEIRTSDGSKVLENKKIKAFEQNGENLKVSVEIGSDLRVNQEYSMQISLDTEGKTVYYYTRIVYRSQVHAGEYAAFVKSFYESCLDKNAADGLAAYLEPENNGAGTNYSNITSTPLCQKSAGEPWSRSYIKKGSRSSKISMRPQQVFPLIISLLPRMTMRIQKFMM